MSEKERGWCPRCSLHGWLRELIFSGLGHSMALSFILSGPRVFSQMKGMARGAADNGGGTDNGCGDATGSGGCWKHNSCIYADIT